MATSYNSVSHHHLADHLLYLSSSSSFWFSLNSSYDHEFHLSKRLGMSPQDYEYLLMALDLASIHKRWGFSIKVMKWKVFLEGYLFSTINCDGMFEVDTKKNGLQRRGRRLLSFGLAFCMPILPEKLRCKKTACDKNREQAKIVRKKG
jgi:hypothetical protein